ncbi:MAG: HNH endonuclease signature motif containing protein [Planctomycetota bacterium]
MQQALSERKKQGCEDETCTLAPEDPAGADDDDDRERERLGRMLIHTSGQTAFYWHAALDLCRQTAGADLSEPEAAEYVLADFVSGGAPLPEDMPKLYPRAPVDYFGGPDLRLCAGRRRLPPVADQLGTHVLDPKLTADLEELLQLVDSEEIPHDPFRLDSSMRRLIAARAGLDLDLARLLHNFKLLGLAAHLGFERFEAYVDARLGISGRRARFLAQLDRKLLGYPAITRAVRDGRIGTVAAMLVARVAEARATEDVWIDRAERTTVARLRREVEWAERGVRLRRFRVPLPPENGRLVTALDELTDELTGQRQTFAVADGETTGSDDDAWVRKVLAGQSPDVDVVFWLGESSVPLWDEARRQIAFHTGESFVPDRVVLLWVALDFLATHLPLWLEALGEEDPIAVRERFRCAIPGCTVHGGSGHHLVFRSHGGPDEPWNLLFVCYLHHIAGVHVGGHVRVTGKAPDRLKIELGVRSDGTALETFVNGERVLPADETGRVSRGEVA